MRWLLSHNDVGLCLGMTPVVQPLSSVRRSTNMRSFALIAAGMLIGVGAVTAGQTTPTRGGYVIEQDAMVAAPEPGPHSGGGQTVAYSFFKSTPGLGLVFRKRALKPGSAIGYHQQKEDERAYVC